MATYRLEWRELVQTRNAENTESENKKKTLKMTNHLRKLLTKGGN